MTALIAELRYWQTQTRIAASSLISARKKVKRVGEEMRKEQVRLHCAKVH
jgi:hypothetical protein